MKQVATELSQIASQQGAVGLDGLAATGQRLAKQVLRLGEPAECPECRGQAAAERERIGVARVQFGLHQIDRRLEQWDCLGQPAGVVVFHGKAATGWRAYRNDPR